MPFIAVMAQRSPFKGQRFLGTKYLLAENLRQSPQTPQPSLKSAFAYRQGTIHKGKSSACTGTAEIPFFEASRHRQLPSQREVSYTSFSRTGSPCSSCLLTHAYSS